PAEAVLAQIWGDVLGVDRVGIHDNFFELGGDSILSIQVVARATQAGVAVTARQLFEQQTVAALAAVAGTAPRVVAPQGLVEGAVPLAPIQRWFVAQARVAPQQFNQAILVQPRQPSARAAVTTAVAA